MEQQAREPDMDADEGVAAEEPAKARIGRAPSLSALVSDLMRETSNLVRNETALARAEISQKVSQVEAGAMLLGVAAVLGIVGLAALVTAAIVALAHVLSLWLSALLIGVGILLVASIFVAVGRGKFNANNLPPQATTANVRKDASMMRGHAQ